MATRDERHGDEPVRITTVAPSRKEEIAGRQRRYLISMAVRTICFVGAILVGPGPLRWVLIAGAVFLPYLAVVFASATPDRREETALRGPDWLGREIGPSPSPRTGRD